MNSESLLKFRPNHIEETVAADTSPTTTMCAALIAQNGNHSDSVVCKVSRLCLCVLFYYFYQLLKLEILKN